MNYNNFTSEWFDSILSSLREYQQESDGLTDQAKQSLINALTLVKNRLYHFGIL